MNDEEHRIRADEARHWAKTVQLMSVELQKMKRPPPDALHIIAAGVYFGLVAYLVFSFLNTIGPDTWCP